MKKLVLTVLTLFGFGISMSVVAGQQQAVPAATDVPGEIIVKFRRGVDSNSRAAMIRSRAAAHLRRFDELELDQIRVGNGRSVAAELAQLRANPAVEFADVNHVLHAVRSAPLPLPNDPFWGDGTLWGMQKIGMSQAWQTFGGGSSSVIVADIDTGVQYTHPDLAPNMWRNPGEIAANGIDDDGNGYVDDVYGIDVVNHDSDPNDDASHGTHTSGTIAGVGNNGAGVVGVTWNAKILACKFLNASGSGSDAGVIECLNYVVWLKNHGQNIRVTSNSYGASRSGPPSQAMQTAFDAAGNAGIINICAAGNSGTNNDTAPFDPASFTSASIISVAASDSADARASFSNYGANSVDIAAPGVNTYSTTLNGAYSYKSGTSMATPHVAGAAAYLAGLDPTLSVANLRVLLLQNVDVLPQWSGVVATGGRLNVFKAASAIGVAPPPSGSTAAFVGQDSSTQGNWLGTYGGDGYVVVNDATSLPSYATVTPTGNSAYTWNGATTEARSLQRANGSGRIAATWYASNSFDIDVNISGSTPKEVGMYLLDWDSTTRSERVDVLDYTNGAVLDTRTATGFNGGLYLRWNIQGHVILRVSRLAGANGVVSGLFFGGASAPSNTPPTVSLTSPAAGANYTVGAPIPLAANASDPGGSIASVAFYADGNLLNTDTTFPYSFSWTNASAGPHTLTAVATDNGSLQTTSSAIAITVGTPSANGASFVKSDVTTRGDWNNGYGSDGYAIINDTTSLPAYATMTPSGQSAYTWASSTTNTGALMRANGSGRIAATWYGGAFDITFNTSGGAHQLALYFLDYDGGNRGQRVDILDATTGTVLDTRTVTAFSGGQYLVWSVTGNVRARITVLSGPNAVVSGVFFGGTAAPGNQPPNVSITGPAGGTTFPSGASITIDANATDLDGSIASVAFYADGNLLNTDTVAPYSYTWTNAATGSHTLTAVATDNLNLTATSAAVQISVSPAGGSTVLFNGLDTTTQGNWIGTYGAAGYSVINDATSLPAWASITPSGQNAFTWTGSTTATQALRRASGTNRIAACYYGGTFDVSVALGDGNAHVIALYFLDWDSTTRQQRIDVIDAVSGVVRDTRTIANFSGGQYLSWTVTGNVKFRITRLGGANAALSGVFIN